MSVYSQLTDKMSKELLGQELNYRNRIESLAGLEYDQELLVKSGALKEFLSSGGIELAPNEIIASPKSRNYRTTSKRRVLQDQTKFSLNYAGEERHELFPSSCLEPKEHGLIYSFLSRQINSSKNRGFALQLNYLILRGSYDELCLIFNIAKLNADMFKAAKIIAENARREFPKLISSIIYLDPTRSDYYLDAKRTERQVKTRRIFGPERLFIRPVEFKYSFSPTGFSQINLSIVPEMLKASEKMLAADGKGTLYDLYCGYGLFSFHLAGHYRRVRGFELSPESIRSALENREHYKGKSDLKFYEAFLDGPSLNSMLPKSIYGSEYFLLDPPRQGTEEGLLSFLLQRHPEKVLHIFCSVDEILKEYVFYKEAGYRPTCIQPLDMFPGTQNLEVLILFEPI